MNVEVTGIDGLNFLSMFIGQCQGGAGQIGADATRANVLQVKHQLIGFHPQGCSQGRSIAKAFVQVSLMGADLIVIFLGVDRIPVDQRSGGHDQVFFVAGRRKMSGQTVNFPPCRGSDIGIDFSSPKKDALLGCHVQAEDG